MTASAPITCRWCIALAVGAAYGKGLKGRPATGMVPYCDTHWDNAYETIHPYPERDWKDVTQPNGAADTLF